MKFLFNNKEYILSDWKIIVNGILVKSLPKIINLGDQIDICRYKDNFKNSPRIGFSKYIGYDHYIIGSEAMFCYGDLEIFAKTYREIYGDLYYSYDKVNEAMISLDKFLLKVDRLKLFI